MAENAFILGFFYGIVPALGFLWIVMKEYHGFFDEKRLFRTFFVGIIVGVLGTVLEGVVAGPALAAVVKDRSFQEFGGLVVVAALMGTLEVLMMTAVLNWRSFRGRKDTPFYGAAFGLGFGASNVLFLMGQTIAGYQLMTRTVPFEDLIIFSLLGAFFAGTILAHGAIGVWIGQGTGVGPLPPKLLRAGAVSATFFLTFFVAQGQILPDLASNLLLLGGLAFGAWLTRLMMERVLDLVVPPEVLREMGLHSRRLARLISREQKPPN